MATVLAIMAHPDDEVLGCGATLARHAEAGDSVHVLFLADGETARQQAYLPDAMSGAIAAREEQAKRAAAVLGCQVPRFARFPDNRLDGVELLQLAKCVEATLCELTPEIVYTHDLGDLNIDHRRTREAVLVACRPLSGRSPRRIYGCEVLSSSEWGDVGGPAFRPRRYVCSASTLDRKIEAMFCYESEMASYPHPRSKEAVRALAILRGAESGLGTAEAFDVIREIDA